MRITDIGLFLLGVFLPAILWVLWVVTNVMLEGFLSFEVISLIFVVFFGLFIWKFWKNKMVLSGMIVGFVALLVFLNMYVRRGVRSRLKPSPVSLPEAHFYNAIK